MNTLLGANWRTTLFGWIAVIASAIAVNPDLIAFLPETIRGYVTGFAGVLAVAFGGTFAAQAKDKNVTGGTVPNDSKSSGNIAPLVALVLLPAFALSGCAWAQAHKTQINSTLAVVGNRALNVAGQVLITAAVDEADKNFKADFLDSIAAGLRANATTIVTADDVSKIVRIWSPNDGTKWQQLAGSLGTLASDALESAGQTQASTIVENIAMGLNNAAATARASSVAQ